MQIWRNLQICRPFVRNLADLRNLQTFFKEFGRSERSADVRDLADLRNLWVFADVRDFADLDRISDEGISGFGRSERSADLQM